MPKGAHLLIFFSSFFYFNLFSFFLILIFILYIPTLIKYNSKTSNYTTYNTAFTNTSLQYLSNAYLNIMKKKNNNNKRIPCTAKYVQF